MKFLLIGIFGMFGVFSRYGVGVLLHRGVTFGLPVGTFLINLSGSFLIGFVYVLGAEKNILSPDLRVAIMGGFLGGFTTFSAFSLETAELLRAGENIQAFLYLFLSGILGVCCTFAGFASARY